MAGNIFNSLKKFSRRIDESPSPYVFLLLAFLVGSYLLWAGLVPMFAPRKGMEPLVPLIIFALLIAHHLLDRPHDLSFLVILSFITVLAGPLIFALNIYRLLTGSMESISNQFGIWRGPILFFGIQLFGLVLIFFNLNYTIKQWKGTEHLERKSLKKKFMFIFIFIFILINVYCILCCRGADQARAWLSRACFLGLFPKIGPMISLKLTPGATTSGSQ